jgi:glycosidase
MDERTTDDRTNDDRTKSADVSQDFVFGTLATDDLRLAQIRAATAGVLHGHDLEPADPRPGDAVRIRVTVGPRVVADRVTAYWTADGSDPAGARGRAENGTAIPLTRSAIAWDTLLWGYREAWNGTIPGQPGGTVVRYRIEAWSAVGDAPSSWASEIAGVVRGELPPGISDLDVALFSFAGELWPVRRHGSDAYAVDDEHVPGWLRDAVIYEVFVDRFATTGGRPFAEPATPAGFYGGTLRGVIERIDHIVDLGVSCIWLSPVFPSPSHHGYDASDHRSIEPRLGTEADLRELIGLAHDRGLRIILDFVANHVSSDHPAFRAAIADRDRPEAGWFTFTRWPDDYLSFFGVRDHPQLDTDAAGVRDELIGSARHWLELGVDGFRCDYAHGPSHAFWSVFRAATRAASPASVTLGEVVETPALQRTYVGRLDGCLDFVLLQALRDSFAFGRMRPSELDAFLRRHLAFFPDDFVMPSFLDNHDMNRFLWVVRGDVRRLKLAALCQFTLPHPPIVYYGTEVGLSQDRDVRSADGSGHPEESRLPMRWGSDRDEDLLDFYRRLIALRRRTAGLWRGERQALLVDDATGLSVHRVVDGDAEALVVLNNGPETSRVGLDPGRRWRLDLATDDAAAVDADTLLIPAFAGAILARP